MVKGMILCAGKGTRLMPLTEKCPKPMVKVLNKPVIDYNIELFRKYNILNIAINLHHHADVIVNYLGDGTKKGVNIVYSIENQILGTAGAIKKLEEFFNNTFVLIYGDVLSKTNIDFLLSFHKSKGAIATIGLYEVENPTECGIVECDDNDRVVRFIEKPIKENVFTNVANAGIYALEPGVMKFIPENTYFDFGKDLFPLLLKNNITIYGYLIKEYLIDIGSIEKLKRAEDEYGRL